MPTPKVKVRKKPTNKRCEKGFPCKTTCISRAKNCKEPLRGQARTFALWEADQMERLAVTNKKRERAGLTPARLNDSKYITAERTKLPQSATAKTTEKVSDTAIADYPRANMLSIKLSKARAEFNALVHDPKARNIAFVAAGNLSKGSKNFHNRHREKLGKKALEIAQLERAIKIEKGEPFTISDIDSAMKDISPLPSDFVNSSMPLFRAAELIRQSFGKTNRLTAKKDILLGFDTPNGIVWKVTAGNKVIQAYKKESTEPQDTPKTKVPIAPPSPEVKPVPSSLQGSKNAIVPSAPDKRLSAILEKQPHEMTEDEFNFARQDILQKLDNIPLNSGEMVRQQDKIAKETREKLKNIGVETYTGSQYSSQGFTFSHAGLGVYYQRSIPPKVRDQANKIIDETKAKIKKLDSDRKQQVDSLGLPPIAFEIIMPGKTHSNYVFYHNLENQQKTEKAITSSKTENDIQSTIAPLEDLAKLRVDKSPKIASGVLLGSERVSDDVGNRYGDGTNAGRYIEYRVRRMPIEEARKYGYTGSGNIALERRPYDDSTTGRYWEGEWQPVHFASNTKELLDQQRGMLGRLESGHPYIKTIKENDRRSKEDEKAKKERDRQATETARVNYKDWMQTHVNQQYANSLPGKKITLHLDLVGEDDSTPTAPVPATRYGNMAVHKKYRYMDKDGTVHLGSTYSISDPSTGVVVVPSIPTLDQARRLTAVLYHEISDKNPIEWTVDERKKAGNVINAFLNGDRPSHITDNSTPVIREKKKARK